MAIEAFEQEFDFESVLRTNEYLVLDFFSTDCPPCEKLAPIYERLACEYPMFKFIKVFRQGNRPLAEKLGVSGSPAVLFFVRGELGSERLSGDISEQSFRNILEGILKKNQIEKKTDVAEEKKLKTDLCIIGTGPAGMTASIYASRYKMDHLLVGELTGGLMTSSHKICNFSTEVEISGMDLSEKMLAVVKANEGKQISDSVTVIKKVEGGFELCLAGGSQILAKTVLLATGTKHRHLGLPHEEELTGRGISYCATCDALFYRNKTVAVIGGGDSANTASLYLADVASKVYQIYRGNKLKGEVVWADLVKENPKITLILETEVRQLIGNDKLQSVLMENKQGEQTSLSLPVIRMVGLLNYEIEADVPESDIAKVETNQNVEITLDAFGEDQIFEGKVTFVEPAETVIQDVVYYKVRVEFDKYDERIKPGMTANLIIETNHKDDVLLVPLRAVKASNGRRFVEVLDSMGVSQEKDVKLGLRGDNGYEILSGLQEGEEVIVYVKKVK